MLSKLLDALIAQETEGLFEYAVIIVDNDKKASARKVVESYQQKGELQIDYIHQPKSGLTYARNSSLEHSRGDFVAILDDDEVPAADWLLQLLRCLEKHQADAVFGSVLPRFETPPPAWIINRKYFFWRDIKHKTGVDTRKCATNNMLMQRDLIEKYQLSFDHDFASAGGEDIQFFLELRKRKHNAKLITCKEAVVHDTVTRDRCTSTYVKKRLLLEGHARILTARKIHKNFFKRQFEYISRFVQSFFRILVIYMVFPFAYIINVDLAKEWFIRSYYHTGILLALFNCSPYMSRKAMGLD